MRQRERESHVPLNDRNVFWESLGDFTDVHTECNYTNLDSITYYTPGLLGTPPSYMRSMVMQCMTVCTYVCIHIPPIYTYSPRHHEYEQKQRNSHSQPQFQRKGHRPVFPWKECQWTCGHVFKAVPPAFPLGAMPTIPEGGAALPFSTQQHKHTKS